jgi:SAM-dependent methyltransferase
MTGGFKDHFSDASNDYRLYRPLYPGELFSYLASVSPEHHCAWDCATGSGQSAIALSEYFSRVIATDASAAQIASATQIASSRSRVDIRYRVARAEQSEITTNSIDLITVAQALHWFDIPAFVLEAVRVLKPGGILAIWTYNLLNIQPKIDRQVNHLYASILGDYWPEERLMVENGYAQISFPFDELKPPSFEMTAEWDLPQLLGYLHTWSALKRYQKQRGVDPIETMMGEFSSSWGAPDFKRTVSWPLCLRVWKKN